MKQTKLDPYLKTEELLDLDFDYSPQSIYRTKYLEGQQV